MRNSSCPAQVTSPQRVICFPKIEVGGQQNNENDISMTLGEHLIAQA
jgi:hypothetical protein